MVRRVVSALNIAAVKALVRHERKDPIRMRSLLRPAIKLKDKRQKNARVNEIIVRPDTGTHFWWGRWYAHSIKEQIFGGWGTHSLTKFCLELKRFQVQAVALCCHLGDR